MVSYGLDTWLAVEMERGKKARHGQHYFINTNHDII